MSRQKAKPERSQTPRRAEPLQSRSGLPLTVTRPELLNDGTDREFRKLVHNIFAFMARHEAIRDGHAKQIGLAGVEYTILISIGHLGLDGDVNVKTVADHLHMSGAFVTTVTSKLQTLGLAEKKPDSVDRQADIARHHRKGAGAAAEACALSARDQRCRVRIAQPRRLSNHVAHPRRADRLERQGLCAAALQVLDQGFHQGGLKRVTPWLPLLLRQIKAGQHHSQSRRLQGGRRLAEQ